MNRVSKTRLWIAFASPPRPTRRSRRPLQSRSLPQSPGRTPRTLSGSTRTAACAFQHQRTVKHQQTRSIPSASAGRRGAVHCSASYMTRATWGREVIHSPEVCWCLCPFCLVPGVELVPKVVLASVQGDHHSPWWLAAVDPRLHHLISVGLVPDNQNPTDKARDFSSTNLLHSVVEENVPSC